ncbi:MAG: family 1 glycosylhydrolase [Verrucomicrobiota bacterium]|nr:family 1 glycosylhydrolase [Verrucomicrobiota bacterium]
MKTAKENGLELWGGIECTINRVGDRYNDQLELAGHYSRISDLDRIAELGIQAIRYPVLWERHPQAQPDFSGDTKRLERIRDLGIDPIVGLVHHGSGPEFTNLLDPQFAPLLAEYAAKVARQFPWVKYYTPVNEPLTTARFSCLYGHWYPHRADSKSFLRSLLIECQATKLAMAAIRTINPAAQLVQTEDMGKTYSTEHMAYQARFDNERRWLSFDLLCGRIDEQHWMWNYLIENGLEPSEILQFKESPCSPDIFGINYYVTSERFLDERLQYYPERNHGGNGRESYADVSAVRVSALGIAGAAGILREVWERYQKPLAITEAHLGCTREEQMRWLKEVWQGCCKLKVEGADIRAVTVWSMLGAYDWASLLTRTDREYEPGAFDLRSSPPRPTGIAQTAAALGDKKSFDHPVLHSPGWWRREIRLLYPPVMPIQSMEALSSAPESTQTAQPLLITGATGTLGKAFARLCEIRGLPYRLLNRQELDIASPEAVETMLSTLKPWAVVNTAGYVRVDQAEAEQERCRRENTTGPATLAKICAAHGIRLVTFSSDLVFDGLKRTPYKESDPVSPLNIYGETKAEGERQALQLFPAALLIRTSAFFGPWDEHNFITVTLNKLRANEIVQAPVDAIVSPTYVPDLVNTTLDLLIDGESGIWHLANQGAITWAELAYLAATRAGLPTHLIEPRPLHKFHLPAARPIYSVLGSERGLLLPTFEQALDKYFLAKRPETVTSIELGRNLNRVDQVSSIPCQTSKAIVPEKATEGRF